MASCIHCVSNKSKQCKSSHSWVRVIVIVMDTGRMCFCYSSRKQRAGSCRCLWHCGRLLEASWEETCKGTMPGRWKNRNKRHEDVYRIKWKGSHAHGGVLFERQDKTWPLRVILVHLWYSALLSVVVRVYVCAHVRARVCLCFAKLLSACGIKWPNRWKNVYVVTLLMPLSM